jgi:hypothetical protein
MRVGEWPENQVHFLGAAVPGAKAQAPPAHSNVFTGAVRGGHDRVGSFLWAAFIRAKNGLVSLLDAAVSG